MIKSAFIIPPFCPPSEYRAKKEKITKIVRKFKNQKTQDYRISYHNYAFEFETEIGGQDALRYILDPSGNNQILAEIDLFWVEKGGIDSARYIEPYAHRMPIIHLKDMTNDDRQTFAEVGEGVIDFMPILEWGEKNGIEWYAVEQDRCDRPPLDCLQTSLTNLKKFAQEV